MSKADDAGSEIKGGRDAGERYGEGEVFRGDHDVTSRFNTKGRLKSHINDAGDLVRANPEGLYKGRKVTAIDANGGWSRYAKEQSPYTSFGWTDGVVAKYGGGGITLDLDGLRGAIAGGEVEGVEIVEHAELLRQIDESELSAFAKRKLSACVKKDNEILVKGVIPNWFITVEQDLDAEAIPSN